MLNTLNYTLGYDTYGTLSLTEGAEPQNFVEPLSLADVKNHLRVEPSMTEDDALIQVFMSAAREQAEIMQRRVLVRKQFDLTYDFWPGYRLKLASPVVSVDLVSYKDDTGNTTELVAGIDYIVDLHKQPAILQAPWNACWPSTSLWPSSAILIRFTAGYAADDQFWAGPGARLKAGMLLLISSWYNNRLPFATGISAANEYPYAVTACLSAGSLKRPR